MALTSQFESDEYASLLQCFATPNVISAESYRVPHVTSAERYRVPVSISSPEPSRPSWWTGGSPMPPNSVKAALEIFPNAIIDTPQSSVSEEEEEKSWCTSLFLKCKKTKKLFMVTVPPNSGKPDIKKLAALLGSKEVRLADDKSRLCLNLSSSEAEKGCLTAMSVVGDTTNSVTSVLDEKMLSPDLNCRMCSGCRDFKNHAQHRIAELSSGDLTKFLEDCNHPPLILNIPRRAEEEKKSSPPPPPQNDNNSNNNDDQKENDGRSNNSSNNNSNNPPPSSSPSPSSSSNSNSNSSSSSSNSKKGGFGGCNILSNGPQTQTQTPTPPSLSKEKKVTTAVDDFLASYCLTPFSKQMALQWMQKLAEDNEGKLDRVKAWVMRKVNKINSRPEGMSEFQKMCPDLVPKLKSQPFWDPSSFESVKLVEANFDVIKQELMEIRANNGQGFQPYRAPSWAERGNQAKDGVGSQSTDTGNWNVFYLNLHNMTFEENIERAPKTSALINSLKDQYHHTFFSALSPKSHITQHCGPTNKKLRVHLPLVVSGNGARMRVGDETVVLEEGKCIVFDDSYNHEAWNDDDKSRIVLIFDLWHPDITLQERKFLSFLTNAQLRVQKKICEQEGDEDNFFSIIDRAGTIVNPNLPQELWA